MSIKVKAGDRVRWTSHASGSATTKEGVVLWVGDRWFWHRRKGKYDCIAALAAKHGIKHTGLSFRADYLGGDGVIVAVPRTARRTGAPIQCWIYSPRMSHLEVIDE